jgi:hypothetical protein
MSRKITKWRIRLTQIDKKEINERATNLSKFYVFFFNLDGVQLGPLGTSAINWPFVFSPGKYEDGEFGGMMIGRGNRSTRRKPAAVPLCPPQIPRDLTRHEPGPPQWEAGD